MPLAITALQITFFCWHLQLVQFTCTWEAAVSITGEELQISNTCSYSIEKKLPLDRLTLLFFKIGSKRRNLSRTFNLWSLTLIARDYSKYNSGDRGGGFSGANMWFVSCWVGQDTFYCSSEKRIEMESRTFVTGLSSFYSRLLGSFSLLL
jgi:hypothetical protein